MVLAVSTANGLEGFFGEWLKGSVAFGRGVAAGVVVAFVAGGCGEVEGDFVGAGDLQYAVLCGGFSAEYSGFEFGAEG